MNIQPNLKKIITLFLILSSPVLLKADTSLAEQLPGKLYNAEGKASSVENLRGKIVALYFSASWCPPCRKFTPKLIDFYNDYSDSLEVVLISLDKNPAAQQKYMQKYKMPWLATENNSSTSKVLGQRYGIQSIPALIILAPDGSLITKEGRKAVEKRPQEAIRSWKNHAGL